jgi:L-iditol 2-dehydrogenase
MKACQLVAFKQVAIRELPVPAPEQGEVLCRIRAVAICGTDPEIFLGHHAGKGWPPRFPFTLGHEWAGEIVALGRGVTEFKVGDRVAGEAHKGCGSCSNCMKGRYTLCLNYGKPETGHRHYGFTAPGANCEYNAYATKALKRLPDNISFVVGSLLDTAGVALHGIDMIGVTPGGAVAVWGPGPIGLCSMQMMKGMGARTVVVVGRGHRLAVAGEIGATDLVDFEKEDPVDRIMKITQGVGVDEIQECSGSSVALNQCVSVVRKGGKINLVGFYEDSKVVLPPLTRFVMNEITLTGSRANPNVSERALNMFSAGIVKGDRVVSHTYPLIKYEEALNTFMNRKDGAIKVVIQP